MNAVYAVNSSQEVSKDEVEPKGNSTHPCRAEPAIEAIGHIVTPNPSPSTPSSRRVGVVVALASHHDLRKASIRGREGREGREAEGHGGIATLGLKFDGSSVSYTSFTPNPPITPGWASHREPGDTKGGRSWWQFPQTSSGGGTVQRNEQGDKDVYTPQIGAGLGAAHR
ncbi:hypothetical protein DFH06DRAFT_1121474 [Mycena polygramma]|nr:hypothetical protein DFH06DRAFT_1121474 [Mycena polygramma]